MSRTQDVLEVGEPVPLGIAARHHARREVHVHARRRTRVAQRVGARPAVQSVRAPAALDPVGAAPAGDDVGMGRTQDVLEVGEPVSLGVAAGDRAGLEVHVHARR